MKAVAQVVRCVFAQVVCTVVAQVVYTLGRNGQAPLKEKMSIVNLAATQGDENEQKTRWISDQLSSQMHFLDNNMNFK
jgi:hypothetical protein